MASPAADWNARTFSFRGLILVDFFHGGRTSTRNSSPGCGPAGFVSSLASLLVEPHLPCSGLFFVAISARNGPITSNTVTAGSFPSSRSSSFGSVRSGGRLRKSGTVTARSSLSPLEFRRCCFFSRCDYSKSQIPAGDHSTGSTPVSSPRSPCSRFGWLAAKHGSSISHFLSPSFLWHCRGLPRSKNQLSRD